MDDGFDNAGSAAVCAIVLAAGRSRRMGGVDKIMAPLLGRPLIMHSLDVFEVSRRVARIVLAAPPGSVEAFDRLVEDAGYEKIEVVSGGERRQDSVRNALAALDTAGWTIVHDGARPCLDGAMIETGLRAAQETGAAVATVPVKDTIKEGDGAGMVIRTLPRERLWAAQTPQVFRTRLLMRAHEQVSEDVTDDASMVEMLGGSVRLFLGSDENLKVTTPADLETAEAILRRRAGGS